MNSKMFKTVGFQWRYFLSLFLTFGLICCGSPQQPEGLAESGGGYGPAIIFDPLIRPIPEIPFPNDLATTMDNTTATGRRLNISEAATTRIERNMRKLINTLDGFGTYMPITVRFDATIDLSTATDANILVIKLLPPGAGEAVPLDLGKGFFPLLARPEAYWPNDLMQNANNRLMDPNNIVDDPGGLVDLDGDTTPDRFVDQYEFETDTLIIRPIVPLEEAGRYAVVLLKDLKGVNGQPVRSPFKYINHTMQTDDLRPVVDLLNRRGISIDRVAFCWSFTTQSISADWINIWNGLSNGTGPLGYLNAAFPPVLTPENTHTGIDSDGNVYTLDAKWLGEMMKNFTAGPVPIDLTAAIDVRYIDYFIFASFRTPTFFNDLNFGDPLKSDERYYSQAKLSGAEPAGELRATLLITLPRDEDLGLDYCRSDEHPYGCKDFEENDLSGTEAKGADGGYGVLGEDDNHDGVIDDRGEYLSPGSDDVPDPACDNHYPDINDFPDHCKTLCFSVGGEPVADWTTGACTQTQGNGLLDSYLSENEDTNGNGKLDTPPFPVILYGNGLTSAAFESFLFVSSNARFGFATVAMDAFGHGPIDMMGQIPALIRDMLEQMGIDFTKTCYKNDLVGSCLITLGVMDMMGVDLNGDTVVDGDDIDGKTIDGILEEMFNIGIFQLLTKFGRAYDVDGDGMTDSGRVTFSGNIFQTRDATRQTAIDFMQLTRIVDRFGTMANIDFNGDTVSDVDGDFNADDTVDLGGPPTPSNPWLYYMGSSLGGITGDTVMAVNPRVVVGTAISGAGGLVNIIERMKMDDIFGFYTLKPILGPVFHQTLGPVVVGSYDQQPGRVTLTFNTDPDDELFGYLYLPAYGRVQVSNLTNGEIKTVTADAQGNFSVGIPADVGDLIEILSLDDHSGVPQSAAYAFSKYHGLGLRRNSPDLRRLMGLAQMCIERGDPVNLAAHYFANPHGTPYPGYPDKSLLQITTLGDNVVPVATGASILSTSGLWDLDTARKMIDKTLNLGYIPESGYGNPIYDPEDMDDDGLKCGFPASHPLCDISDPGLAPLPVVPVANGTRVSAARFHFVEDVGHHAFAMPGTVYNGIERAVYMSNQVGYFFASGGTCVIDDPWELHAAPMITPGPDGVLDTTPSAQDETRTVRILSTLGKDPCNYPFPTMNVITTGPDFTIESSAANDDVFIDYGDMYRGP